MKRYIETIKINDGVPQNLAAHLTRMERTIGYVHPLVLHTTIGGVVKCRIVYDANSVHQISYASYTQPTTETLQMIESDEIDYASKYEDRSAINRLFENRCPKADDILIIKNGLVTDTSFCNVVFESSTALVTPRVPLLRGTQRQRLLDLGIITECDISLKDIANYQRIYLVNAMIDIVQAPVVRCCDLIGSL